MTLMFLPTAWLAALWLSSLAGSPPAGGMWLYAVPVMLAANRSVGCGVGLAMLATLCAVTAGGPDVETTVGLSAWILARLLAVVAGVRIGWTLRQDRQSK